MQKKNDNRRDPSKEQDGFEEKVVHVNRCSKVVKGGRKFSFSALVLVGNGEGIVGYGFAKANELSDAIKKAGQNARKNTIKIKLEKTTIPHEVRLNYDGVKILLKPAKEGTGVIAGSGARAVFELAGIKDIIGKSLGANNPINMVKATFEALESLMTHEEIHALRG
jgi:small subunit ribosomal protein S5